jgi:alpha-1,6-mannosyltransferase
MSLTNKKILFFVLIILSAAAYSYLAYFHQRKNFEIFIFSIIFLFGSFIKLKELNANYLFLLGIAFRLIFISSIPFLSQDFYRFLWDGELISKGFNPYLYTPDQLINLNSIEINNKSFLFDGMGPLSNQNFSNYPPLNQFIFGFASILSFGSWSNSVIIIRIILILSDIGLFFVGKKLLTQINLSPNLIFIYFLNPLVIIEITGNLHFEGPMLFLFLCSLYYFKQNHWIKSAIFLGFSVLLKLLPLLIFPLVFFSKRNNNKLIFSLVFFLVCLFGFLPFIDITFLKNYGKTINLWFSNFEFNASFYYVFRSLGYYLSGYNMISIFGKISIVALIISNYIFIKNKKLENENYSIYSILVTLSFYFFFSTTIHPWYVITLLLLGIYTKKLFPIIWSFTVFFSYSAYSNDSFAENYLWLIAEYLPVYYLFYLEIIKKRNIWDQLGL